ncbi:MAG TPA: histidine kinase [Burkholderiales bacterium]|nr:histidine kinase [Burkholderiales bacterium]
MRPFATLPRNALIVAAFNTLVALSITLVQRESGLLDNFVFSQCIGMLVYLTVDLLRRAFWPRGLGSFAVLLALAALGMLVGYFGGTALAAAILGYPWQPAGLNEPDAGKTVVLTLWGGVLGSWFFWNRARLAGLRARSEATERRALEAQLRMLQAQIEPHFLFNTLANLDALIALDPARARVMLGHLNDYLRASLAAARSERHTLGDEFALLSEYLELLAIRMGPRLAFTLDLPSALAPEPLPPMLLQPLVENALKHGLEPKVEGGRVTVRARRDGAALVLTVADDGLGLGAARSPGTGVGLAHLRERLAALYGGAAALELRAAPGGGVAATITIPGASHAG